MDQDDEEYIDEDNEVMDEFQAAFIPATTTHPAKSTPNIYEDIAFNRLLETLREGVTEGSPN